jgi:hypothetical protein
LRGKKQLDIDPKYIDALLADSSEPPEIRFCAVMEALLPAMIESRNGTIAQVGQRLKAFWDDDMANTEMHTP